MADAKYSFPINVYSVCALLYIHKHICIRNIYKLRIMLAEAPCVMRLRLRFVFRDVDAPLFWLEIFIFIFCSVFFIRVGLVCWLLLVLLLPAVRRNSNSFTYIHKYNIYMFKKNTHTHAPNARFCFCVPSTAKYLWRVFGAISTTRHGDQNILQASSTIRALRGVDGHYSRLYFLGRFFLVWVRWEECAVE